MITAQWLQKFSFLTLIIVVIEFHLLFNAHLLLVLWSDHFLETMDYETISSLLSYCLDKHLHILSCGDVDQTYTSKYLVR